MSSLMESCSIRSNPLLPNPNNKNKNAPRLTKQQCMQRCMWLFPWYTMPPVQHATADQNLERPDHAHFFPPLTRSRVMMERVNIPQSVGKGMGSRLQLVRVLGSGVSGVVIFATELEKENHKEGGHEAPLRQQSRRMSLRGASQDTVDDLEVSNSHCISSIDSKLPQPRQRCCVAVKLIDLEGEDEGRRKRALREVKCHLSCNFFSILRCYSDYARLLHPEHLPHPVDNPVIAVALELEYANNGDLREEIRTRLKKNHKLFSERDALLIFVQLLMAVYYLHKRGILHRDIKAANVLLCSNGLVKLGDFGLSKIVEGSGDTDEKGSFVGTPYYLTPEIWLRKPYGKKADMFSLGVLLYELLTLKRPFDGNDLQTIRESVLGKTPEFPPCVNSDVAQIVLSLLQKDPRRRPSAEEVLSMPLMRMIFATFLECVLREGRYLTPTRQRRKSAPEDGQPSKSLVSSRDDPESNCRLSSEERQQVLSDLEHVHSDLILWAARNTEGKGRISLDVSRQNISMGGNTEIILDGVLYRETDGYWKERYLSLQWVLVAKDSSDKEESPCPQGIELVLALKKDSTQRVRRDMNGFIDCFPVPERYALSNASYVFTLLNKAGHKVTFQASSEEERQRWVNACLDAIEYERRNRMPHDKCGKTKFAPHVDSVNSIATFQTFSSNSARSVHISILNCSESQPLSGRKVNKPPSLHDHSAILPSTCT